ncbi:histamine H2 receptor-like [Amphiura filiformis]|uniref:histamine H2 receptor-like n=1 Tax=Amphiura filiformis TaxID=82378 RepID=UPI003B223BA8
MANMSGIMAMVNVPDDSALAVQMTTRQLTSTHLTYESCQTTPKKLLIFKIFVLSSAIIANLFGNLLCLLVIRRNRRMEPVTRILMTSVTLADLCIAVLISSPILGATIVDRWPYGDIFCTIHGMINNIFVLCCVCSLLLLNLDRYLCITRPFQYPTLVTTFRARLMVVTIWVASAVFSAAIGGFLPNRSTRYSAPLHACIAGPIDTHKPDITGNVFLIGFVIIPILLILTMYVRLLIIAKHHATRIAAAEIQHGVGKQLNKSKRKAFSTFFLMTLCLIFVTFPLILVYMYENATSEELPREYIFIAETVAMTIGIWNLSIYYARNAEFRHAAKDLLIRIFQILMPM